MSESRIIRPNTPREMFGQAQVKQEVIGNHPIPVIQQPGVTPGIGQVDPLSGNRTVTGDHIVHKLAELDVKLHAANREIVFLRGVVSALVSRLETDVANPFELNELAEQLIDRLVVRDAHGEVVDSGVDS